MTIQNIHHAPSHTLRSSTLSRLPNKTPNIRFRGNEDNPAEKPSTKTRTPSLQDLLTLVKEKPLDALVMTMGFSVGALFTFPILMLLIGYQTFLGLKSLLSQKKDTPPPPPAQDIAPFEPFATKPRPATFVPPPVKKPQRNTPPEE